MNGRNLDERIRWRMDGWMDGRMDQWMYGQKHGRVTYHVHAQPMGPSRSGLAADSEGTHTCIGPYHEELHRALS